MFIWLNNMLSPKMIITQLLIINLLLVIIVELGKIRVWLILIDRYETC